MEPYVHQPYPSCRYSRAGQTQIVNDPSEDEALQATGDWADTPAAFTEPAEAPAEPAAEAQDATPPAEEGSDPGPETDEAAAAEDASAQAKPAKRARKA